MIPDWDTLEPTADPSVHIEAEEPGYIRYQANDGRRWEVRGVCDYRGLCMVGANILVGEELVEIQSLEHLEQLKQQVGVQRFDSELDVPVGPGFEGCCPLEITVLAD